MTYRWHEGRRRLVDGAGQTRMLPFLTDKAQFDRWTAAGYDVTQACLRRDQFLDKVAAADRSSVAGMLARYNAAETAWALKSGIVEQDNDPWRIAAFAKHFVA